MLEEDYSFTCPYCLADISLRVDYTGGRKQAFTYDCETCCQPIAVRLETDGEEVVDFSAEKES